MVLPEYFDKGFRQLELAPEVDNLWNAAWQEFVMVMNGFDTDFDRENEFYAVNSIPFTWVSPRAAQALRRHLHAHGYSPLGLAELRAGVAAR